MLSNDSIVNTAERIGDALISRKKSFSLVLRESQEFTTLLKAAARKVDIEVEMTSVERVSRNEALDHTLQFIYVYRIALKEKFRAELVLNVVVP